MLEDMDQMEASCVFYVLVGTLNPLEQSRISILTVTTLGIAMLTIHHFKIFKVCFMRDPRDFLRQTSEDVLSVKECGVDISQTRDFGCHSP